MQQGRPGKFPLFRGSNSKYADLPIEDVPQDVMWWALRPSNSQRDWYQPLYDANKRFLDDVYKSRSPGSELIWFGKYRGHRLDQVYQRKGYMHWCFDPQRQESGPLSRFKDLVYRLQDWRLAHPERCGPRQRRKAPDIQNPVGEAIGPWDDSPGSADEDDYARDGFVQSDSDELEYSSDSDDEFMDDGSVDDGSADDHFSEDSDESTSSSVEMVPSGGHTHRRRRTNVILLDEELVESDTSARKLGKRYRVQCESSQEVVAPARKSSRRMQ
ncbi:hypothetical protein J3R82DRAFT_7344 [Butyriboletus roseoflavus]|nr:hypothetical protein J3R82DRAFT_7344 [Butyriboletus roseoflavus]